MAAGTKLQLKFETMAGIKTWNFNYAKSEPTDQQVRTAMQAMITNGSVFEHPPIRASSAKTITTTETVFDIE